MQAVRIFIRLGLISSLMNCIFKIYSAFHKTFDKRFPNFV